jgi:hypothetical protein
MITRQQLEGALKLLTEAASASFPARLEGTASGAMTILHAEHLIWLKEADMIWYCDYCTLGNMASAWESGNTDQFAFAVYHRRDEED